MEPLYDGFKTRIMTSRLMIGMIFILVGTALSCIAMSIMCIIQYEKFCMFIFGIGGLSLILVICVGYLFIRYIWCDASRHIEPTLQPRSKSKKRSKKKKSSKENPEDVVISIDNPMH